MVKRTKRDVIAFLTQVPEDMSPDGAVWVGKIPSETLATVERVHDVLEPVSLEFAVSIAKADADEWCVLFRFLREKRNLEVRMVGDAVEARDFAILLPDNEADALTYVEEWKTRVVNLNTLPEIVKSFNSQHGNHYYEHEVA